MKKAIFGLPIQKNEFDLLADVVCSDDMTLVSALGGVPPFFVTDVLNDTDGHELIREAAYAVGPLVGSKWPKIEAEIVAMMAESPKDAATWLTRSMLWMAATRSLIYLVTASNTALIDVAVLLTAARVLRVPTVGIIPAGLRDVLDSSMLTLTDHIASDSTARRVIEHVYHRPPQPQQQQQGEVKLAR